MKCLIAAMQALRSFSLHAPILLSSCISDSKPTSRLRNTHHSAQTSRIPSNYPSCPFSNTTTTSLEPSSLCCPDTKLLKTLLTNRDGTTALCANATSSSTKRDTSQLILIQISSQTSPYLLQALLLLYTLSWAELWSFGICMSWDNFYLDGHRFRRSPSMWSGGDGIEVMKHTLCTERRKQFQCGCDDAATSFLDLGCGVSRLLIRA